MKYCMYVLSLLIFPFLYSCKNESASEKTHIISPDSIEDRNQSDNKKGLESDSSIVSVPEIASDDQDKISRLDQKYKDCFENTDQFESDDLHCKGESLKD